MIVAPLVFTTLVVGVAKLGDISSVGRIGGKTLAWFLSASLMSLLLGMIMVNIFKPGDAMNLPLPDLHEHLDIERGDFSLKNFLYHVFPSSVIDAMAKNEILQIVVFSLLFGVATAALGERGHVIIHFFDTVAQVILKITGYVMNLAPFAVFGAMTAIVAKQGPGILHTYLTFISEFYVSLFLLWSLLILGGFCIIGTRVLSLMRQVKEPILLAFSTSSSEAAFPKTMEELGKFGCKDNVVSFVLPLGYSFNLDGSMMYMTFASLFIAQSYGMDLSLPTQLTMLLVLMLTSKGIAGVPRASLVVIAGTLATFNIPEAGLALLLGIDPLLDMGRSATNVVGNSIATAVVSKWEGALASSAAGNRASSSRCSLLNGSRTDILIEGCPSIKPAKRADSMACWSVAHRPTVTRISNRTDFSPIFRLSAIPSCNIGSRSLAPCSKASATLLDNAMPTPSWSPMVRNSARLCS